MNSGNRKPNNMAVLGLCRFAMLLALLVSACSSTPDTSLPKEPEATSRSAQTSDVASDRESAGTTPVSVKWSESTNGTSKSTDHFLTVRVTNNMPYSQKGTLQLVAAGLDGREASRQLGTFNLKANESRERSFPVASLPIHTEIAPCHAEVVAEMDGPDGTLRFATSPMYYLFNGEYKNVELYTADEVTALPDRGLRTTDVMNIRGRVFDASTNTMRELTSSASKASSEGTVGLSIAGHGTSQMRQESLALSSSSSSSAVSASVQVAGATGDTSQIKVCYWWYVRYTDSGLGEDILNSNSAQIVQASFVWAQVDLAQGGYTYWAGNTDKFGCTPYITVPSYIILKTTQYSDWIIDPARNIWFDNYYGLEGDYTYIDTYFMSPATGSKLVSIAPSYNDNNVQTAAISGLVLQKNIDFDGNNFGIAFDTHYKIYTALGCENNWGWDPAVSCHIYNQSLGYTQIYIGPNSGGGGSAGTQWKFMIAHEIGHSVQQRSMGIPGLSENMYNIGNEPGNIRRCKCDHVTSMNQHCLQSREVYNAAAMEGFAQAFATRLFNSLTHSNATFVYYKEFQNSETPGDVAPPPVAKDGLNARHWMRSTCTAAADRGVEWDWLTFLYSIQSRDSAGGRAPATRTSSVDLFLIYRLACTGGTGSLCPDSANPRWNTGPGSDDLYVYPTKVAARNYFGGGYAEPRYLRFADTAYNYGVDY